MQRVSLCSFGRLGPASVHSGQRQAVPQGVAYARRGDKWPCSGSQSVASHVKADETTEIASHPPFQAADASSLEAYKWGRHADASEEDFPAYLLRWADVLRAQDAHLQDLTHLQPAELADFLVECALLDKKAAVSYGALIIEHQLCVKYASSYDLDTCYRHWVSEITHQREALVALCQSKVILNHLAAELDKVFEQGKRMYKSKLLKNTIGSPAADISGEGLDMDWLLGSWWPERLRSLLEESDYLVVQESDGMIEAL